MEDAVVVSDQSGGTKSLYLEIKPKNLPDYMEETLEGVDQRLRAIVETKNLC